MGRASGYIVTSLPSELRLVEHSQISHALVARRLANSERSHSTYLLRPHTGPASRILENDIPSVHLSSPTISVPNKHSEPVEEAIF